jgi:hypothetical protein
MKGDHMRSKMQNLLYALLYAVAGGQILRYADIPSPSMFFVIFKLRGHCKNVKSIQTF